MCTAVSQTFIGLFFFFFFMKGQIELNRSLDRLIVVYSRSDENNQKRFSDRAIFFMHNINGFDSIRVQCTLFNTLFFTRKEIRIMIVRDRFVASLKLRSHIS